MNAARWSHTATLLTNGLVLHGTTNLGGGAWVTMTNAPSATNGVNFLTVLPTNSQQYFRLQLP